DMLLFFLPNTPANHVSVITSKLIALSEEQTTQHLRLDFRLRALPDPALDDNATIWVQQLLGEFTS
ncbi:MAG: hypothetical protein EOM46_25520, partial [Gammaproteobacteria bacterium]|nr:hypothetical protein [Gammaproteobacteria bacterium]